MRHALSVALQEFEGAMIVVSHDRHLLRTVTDSLLLVDSGIVSAFDGDIDDYRQWVKDHDKEEQIPQKITTVTKQSKNTGTKDRES